MFDPEYGADELLPDYTASYPTRQYSSSFIDFTVTIEFKVIKATSP
jgi:hypothetical protein